MRQYRGRIGYGFARIRDRKAVSTTESDGLSVDQEIVTDVGVKLMAWTFVIAGAVTPPPTPPPPFPPPGFGGEDVAAPTVAVTDTPSFPTIGTLSSPNPQTYPRSSRATVADAGFVRRIDPPEAFVPIRIATFDPCRDRTQTRIRRSRKHKRRTRYGNPQTPAAEDAASERGSRIRHSAIRKIDISETDRTQT